MTLEEGPGPPTSLAPEEVFAILGNETRIQILQTLGEAPGPLSFTELRDRVGIQQGGQFSYHLGQLGHFVRKREDGYELRQTGRYVIQAVLSGAVTDGSVREPTRVEQRCPRCDGPTEVRYHQGDVEQFCTECDGTFGRHGPTQQGYLGCLTLPPAGLQGRTNDDVVRVAWTWTQLQSQAIARGICPNCSAGLERWVDVCEEHDTSDGVCDRCGRRYAVQLHYRCTNCIFDGESTFSAALVANIDFLAFLISHGLDPISPTRFATVQRVFDDYDEVVRSTDPFEADFTFTVDGDALTLTVDADLSVTDAERRTATDPVS